MTYQRHKEENQEDKENDLRYPCRSQRNSREAEHRCNKRQNKKS